jgi:GTPase SAR1 family protein
MRILVCGPQGAGKTTLIRAFRGRPPFPKYRPTFYQRFTDKFVQVYNKTIDLEIWDAGEEGTVAISEMRFNCIIVCVNIAAPQQLEEIPNSQWFQSINGKWADTPKIVVGLRADYRRSSWASPLISESEGNTFAEKIGAVSYTELCALTADPNTLRELFEQVANTIIMSKLYVLPDKEPYQDEFEEEKKKIKGDCAARSIFNALKLWGDREFLGVRDRAPDGKPLNTYSWVTFRKFSHRAEHFGSGLRHLIPSRSFVVLSAPNCPEWLASDIGIMRGNMVGVTVHFTTPPDDLIFILGQTKASAACIGSKLIPAVRTHAKDLGYLFLMLSIRVPVR